METSPLLTKDEEEALLRCPHFAVVLARALDALEREDYYNLTTPLRNVETALFKLVISARASLYSKRLRRIREKLDGRS